MKKWYQSKEIWLSIAVVANAILAGFGFPAFELSPAFIGAIGVVFFTLRSYYTETRIKWS